MTSALIRTPQRELISDGDPLNALADFLRINVAGGDASAATIRAYFTHIRQYVEWAQDYGLPPSQATESDIALYRRHLVEQAYSRGTIAVKLSALRRFFDAAIWRGLRQDNPAAGLRPPADRTSRADRIRRKFYSAVDVETILAQIDVAGPAGLRDAALVMLMFYHGLRISDAVGLDLEDYKPRSSPPLLTIRSGKGKKDRTNILIPETIRAVDAWLAARETLNRHHLDDWPALFICLSNRNRGGRLAAGGARQTFNRYAQAAGVYAPGRSLHGLRHGHATEAIKAGVPPIVLAREMGHASIATTEQYVHVAQSITNNPAAAIAKAHTEKQP